MEKRLYVGNLPFETTEEDLSEMFQSFGQVVSAKLITDRETGRSRGFGFVELDTEEAAQNAIQEKDGSTVGSRQITVNEARPRPDR